MGGGMGTRDTDCFSWLPSEKIFIQQAIDHNKLVLGICLGAQLIAEALGGVVSKNAHREIGWFPVVQTNSALSSSFWKIFPGRFTPFHWHGDTFSIPPLCCHSFFSQACQNQAFDYDNGRVVGLQFHLEVSETSVERFILSCAQDLEVSSSVQSAHDLLKGTPYISNMYVLLTRLLDTMITARGG
ncbi:MAG: gamma-glutamyl-gamma-aminobutyrate hydrolase family protein [Candidatus Margulisiibacteriota bacterium]